MHQQCREERQETSIDSPKLQGRYQISYRHDETWLHWRIWNRWWPSRWKGCRQPHWTLEQGRNHLTKIRRSNPRHWKVDKHTPSISSVWVRFLLTFFMLHRVLIMLFDILDMLYSQPVVVSWITRKPVESTWEERF